MTTWTDADLIRFGDARRYGSPACAATIRCVRLSSCGWCALATTSTPDR